MEIKRVRIASVDGEAVTLTLKEDGSSEGELAIPVETSCVLRLVPSVEGDVLVIEVIQTTD